MSVPLVSALDKIYLYFTGDKNEASIIRAVKELVIARQIIAVPKTISCRNRR